MEKKPSPQKKRVSANRRRDKDSQVDFEIKFYQALVKDKPDYLDALVCLADAYTRKGRCRKGLEIDRKLVCLQPENPIFHYNLACSYSLLRMLEQANRALRKAIELGYRDFRFMNADPDLENLRRSRRYQALVKELRLTRE